MTQKQRHIAVVGGGTAGWLAALMLRKAAPDKRAIRISVVESPNIPTVGVGEGSTAIFRQVLLDLELDEAEFIRDTGATLKFGIKHAGWRKDGKNYWGPIDDPNALRPAPPSIPSNWLHHARLAAGKPVADLHLFTMLMRQGKSGLAMDKDDTVPLSPYHHAYHFDQARLGRFLSGKATDIHHILTEVDGVEIDGETGDITGLVCVDRDAIEVDFVIDCTGFRRAIISEVGSRWRSYGDMLPLNKAMPFWLDHADPARIPNFTLAQAMGSGWMWGIPVQDRMGCGYVFSDAHISAEDAQSEIEKHLGMTVDVRRIINIDPGRLEEAWIGNCCALGLAQSFLEPLEATSIHGTLVQLILLIGSGLVDPRGNLTDAARQTYNGQVARQVDDFADFINMHYAGGRTDTGFWRDMTHSGIAAQQNAKLKKWQSAPLVPQDFAPFPGRLPHVEEQLYLPVLNGLGLLPKSPSKALVRDVGIRSSARKNADALQDEFRSAAAKAISHAVYLARTGT